MWTKNSNIWVELDVAVSVMPVIPPADPQTIALALSCPCLALVHPQRPPHSRPHPLLIPGPTLENGRRRSPELYASTVGVRRERLCWPGGGARAREPAGARGSGGLGRPVACVRVAAGVFQKDRQLWQLGRGRRRGHGGAVLVSGGGKAAGDVEGEGDGGCGFGG